MTAFWLVSALLAAGHVRSCWAGECAAGYACPAVGAAEDEESALLQGRRAATKRAAGEQEGGRRIDPATGAWGPEDVREHVFDATLAEAFVGYMKRKGAQTVTDMGCGLGNYSRAFITGGFRTACYDANPVTADVTGGLCQVQNLAVKGLNLSVTDYVLALEVGEQIPKEFEQNFLDNVAHAASLGIILSWALPGQGGHGHVNEQKNVYIYEQLEKRGFHYIEHETERLKGAVTMRWFKNSLMVFERILGWVKTNV